MIHKSKPMFDMVVQWSFQDTKNCIPLNLLGPTTVLNECTVLYISSLGQKPLTLRC